MRIFTNRGIYMKFTFSAQLNSHAVGFNYELTTNFASNEEENTHYRKQWIAWSEIT